LCVIITIVFTALSIHFFSEGDTTNALINGAIAFFFLALIIRNIRKTIEERK
jgi:hypothetical protein